MAADDQREDRIDIRLDRSIARTVVITTIVVIALALLLVWPGVPFTILAGILVALTLDACMRPMTSRGWPRWAALAMVAVIVLPVLVAVFTFALPSLAEQARQLSERLPTVWTDTRERIASYAGGSTLIDLVSDASSKDGTPLAGLAAWLSSWLGSVAVVVLHMVLMLVLGIYLALSPGVYRRGWQILVPPPHRERSAQLTATLHHDLQRWLVGKLVAMAVIAVATTVGLWVIGVPLAMLNGVIAGVLSFVPNFGPIASLIPPLLLVLGDSPGQALSVVLLYVGIQAAESYLITPQIMQHAVALPPGIILSAQLLLGTALGPYGLVFAVPALIVVLDMIGSFREHRPFDAEADGDPEAEPP